jgi:hypothetical protein
MVDAYGSSQEHVVDLKKWEQVDLDHRHEGTPLLWCHCYCLMNALTAGSTKAVPEEQKACLM